MKVLSSIVLVLAIIGLTGVAALGEDAPKAAPAAKMAYGKVVKVSEDGKSLTLNSGGEHAKEVVVTIGEKTVITVDGKEAKASDLKAGMVAVATLGEGAATKIVATTAQGNPK